MAFISEYVERDEIQPGVFQATIHSSPIAYRQNGELLRIVDDFEDGDAQHPNIVTRAPLRSRSANDGTRRMYPVPGDDTKYMEIGAPFVQISGTWTQVSLGTPTRSANKIVWTRPQTITTVTHVGHFVKLEIELRNGFVPENSRIAFPVGLSGLTRSGINILNDGEVVAKLRPFVMYDADNPEDERPIAHAFQSLAGQPYLVLTLPSLGGMARPVIDPTLTLQPAGTSGIDTILVSDSPATNFATASLSVGEKNDSTSTRRTLVKFDLSTLPSSAVISSATLSLYATLDFSSNARTIRVYRQKKAWVENQATWNIYSTGNNWTTAGGFDVADCEQTDIGNRAFTATETLNQFKDFSLTPTTKADLDLGNGWLIKADTESDDAYSFASSDDATAGNRPKLVVVYTVAYTLTAAQASFTLTGQTANVLRKFTLTAAQDSFTLSGQTVSLLFGHRLTATQTTYALTGEDASLPYGRIIAADYAGFALSGQDTGLSVGYLLTAIVRTYALSGQSVTLTYSGVVAVVTPSSRIYVVPYQNRTFTVVS